MDEKLNDGQQRFANEYLIDLNATQAAIRAGYSAKTAGQAGDRLLKNPKIQKYIAQRIKLRAERTEITQDKVLQELAKIGFSDIRKAVRWNESGIELVSSGEIDDSTAGAIAEISQTAQGLKIKLHDKRAALVDIGRHLGMFEDKAKTKSEADIASALRELATNLPV